MCASVSGARARRSPTSPTAAFNWLSGPVAHLKIRRWILGWGDAVEVISPKDLRDEIKRISNVVASPDGI
jgi:hypothetical protein